MSNQKANNESAILVLGASGKTGSRVLQRLNQLGWPTRIGSRSANPKFEWMDETTWKPVLSGIDSVYITFQPDLAVAGAVKIIESFTETAIENGVRKLVLLSGRGEEAAQKCEKIVMEAGAEWTIVRASWFFQNFSESYLLDPIQAGYVALPAGNIGEPFVDADDIADVAAAALTDKKHNGQVYDLTGPRILTFQEAIEEIAKSAGRSIEYQQVSIDEYVAILHEYNVPKEYIDLLSYLYTEVAGHNATLTNDVQRALGRKPTDFTDYVRKTAATGVWSKMLTANQS